MQFEMLPEEIKIYLESFVSNMEINRLQIKEKLLQINLKNLLSAQFVWKKLKPQRKR